MLNFVRAALLGLALASPSAGLAGADLPKGFVYLSDIAPEIQQQIKYAGSDNFLARPVAGYAAPRCILTTAAANALAQAAQALAKENLHLRVFDCYRPKRAVADFVAWSHSTEPAPAKAYYFARYSKKGLFQAGFIAKRSGHSRGSTVDLTLANTFDDHPYESQQIFLKTTQAPRCDAPQITERHSLNGALDMGTDFDCFSPLSATHSRKISTTAQTNRKHLLQALKKVGFRNHSAEWWHFSLINAPFRKQYLDFIVQ